MDDSGIAKAELAKWLDAQEGFALLQGTHTVADALADDGKYPMIEDDPAHAAGSIYGTVTALWEARSRIAELEDRLGEKLNEGGVAPG